MLVNNPLHSIVPQSQGIWSKTVVLKSQINMSCDPVLSLPIRKLPRSHDMLIYALKITFYTQPYGYLAVSLSGTFFNELQTGPIHSIKIPMTEC